jgi:hypothetical protein
MVRGVGADIESMCSKCGDVWHVIVAKVADKIVKVQCKECGALHRYRPLSGAAPATRSKRSTKKAAVPSGVPQVEPDHSRPIKKYSVRETFLVQDQVNHPIFGVGVVEDVKPGKIQVWFPDGRKVLAAAKPNTSLAPGGRARPIDGES